GEVTLDDGSARIIGFAPERDCLLGGGDAVIRRGSGRDDARSRLLLNRALAAERLDRSAKVDAVDMHHEGDDVAMSAAASAIETLLADVDREAVSPAAGRARPAAIDTPAQHDA